MEAEDREKLICVLRAINWEQFFRVRVLAQGIRRRGQDEGQGQQFRIRVVISQVPAMSSCE